MCCVVFVQKSVQIYKKYSNIQSKMANQARLFRLIGNHRLQSFQIVLAHTDIFIFQNLHILVQFHQIRHARWDVQLHNLFVGEVFHKLDDTTDTVTVRYDEDLTVLVKVFHNAGIP